MTVSPTQLLICTILKDERSIFNCYYLQKASVGKHIWPLSHTQPLVSTQKHQLTCDTKLQEGKSAMKLFHCVINVLKCNDYVYRITTSSLALGWHRSGKPYQHNYGIVIWYLHFVIHPTKIPASHWWKSGQYFLLSKSYINNLYMMH